VPHVSKSREKVDTVVSHDKTQAHYYGKVSKST
jgi:hypothetical protein